MSISHEPGPLNLNPLSEKLQWFADHGFRATDAQFSIARPGGFDLVNPENKKRLYVAGQGSAEGEGLVAEVLGSDAILKVTELGDGFAVYDLPRGSRSLKKSLKSGPYELPYMQSLALRSLQFLDRLSKVDANLFGLDLRGIAITHNGDAKPTDDIVLTVIPPLERPVHDVSNDRERQRLVAKLRRQTIGQVAMDKSVVAMYQQLMQDTQVSRIGIDLSLLDRYFINQVVELEDGTS